MPYANNKGADQPAYLRSLITTFVVRCLDSNDMYTCYIQSFKILLASVAEQAGLNLTWLKIPVAQRHVFGDVAHLNSYLCTWQAKLKYIEFINQPV